MCILYVDVIILLSFSQSLYKTTRLGLQAILQKLCYCRDSAMHPGQSLGPDPRQGPSPFLDSTRTRSGLGLQP